MRSESPAYVVLRKSARRLLWFVESENARDGSQPVTSHNKTA
jgi:hypothetical protein